MRDPSAPIQNVLRTDARAGEYVLVSGLGPVGLCVVRLVAAMAGGRFSGVDPVEYRRNLSLEHGAQLAIDPLNSDMRKVVMEITGEGSEVLCRRHCHHRIQGRRHVAKPAGATGLGHLPGLYTRSKHVRAQTTLPTSWQEPLETTGAPQDEISYLDALRV